MATVAPGPRLSAHGLDRAPAPAGVGEGPGLRPSDETVRRGLRRLGYVWKRPRYVLDPDPRAREKNGGSGGRSGPCRAGASCWPRTRPTCCCSRRCGPAGRRRGEPAEVRISGRNARRVIFGAMNLRTGTRLFLPRPKGRAGDFQAFLGEVRRHYRGWHVALLLDGDPEPHGEGVAAGGRGDDAAVAAEAVAGVEPDGHAVGPGQGRGRRQQAVRDDRRAGGPLPRLT